MWELWLIYATNFLFLYYYYLSYLLSYAITHWPFLLLASSLPLCSSASPSLYLCQLISISLRGSFFLFDSLLMDEVGTCGKQLCPVCAYAHVHFCVQRMGTSCGQQLCIVCVCVHALISRCVQIPILWSSCVCLVTDSCLVAGDYFRSQADSDPGKQPRGQQGEWKPVRCKAVRARLLLNQAFWTSAG